MVPHQRYPNNGMFPGYGDLGSEIGKELLSRPSEATGAHNACFQRVQDDMSKTRSVSRDWEFVSKGTEISLGKFVSEFFTPLTLDVRGVVSTEDTEER